MPEHRYNPQFDNLRGHMLEYDHQDPRPTAWNIACLVEELKGGIQTDEAGTAQSWDDVIHSMEHCLKFWRSYYCGIHPVVG